VLDGAGQIQWPLLVSGNHVQYLNPPYVEICGLLPGQGGCATTTEGTVDLTGKIPVGALRASILLDPEITSGEGVGGGINTIYSCFVFHIVSGYNDGCVMLYAPPYQHAASQYVAEFAVPDNRNVYYQFYGNTGVVAAMRFGYFLRSYTVANGG
jgi:hypothetical protein